VLLGGRGWRPGRACGVWAWLPGWGSGFLRGRLLWTRCGSAGLGTAAGGVCLFGVWALLVVGAGLLARLVAGVGAAKSDDGDTAAPGNDPPSG